jgi:serine acetyltransferase
VTIGEGAIVGSGSVVTKDVEPWTISVGSPARVVARRESATIKALEARLYETAGIEPFDPTPFLALKKEHVQLPTAL